MDFDGRAVMNIDGRDQPSKLAAWSEPKRRYEAGGVLVNVRYVVTGICKPDDESCEVPSYDALVTVKARSGSADRSLKVS